MDKNNEVQRALNQLGRLAKQRREQIGLGRVAMAKEAGIGSDSTIQQFEFGQRMPRGKTLRLMEAILRWKAGVIDDVLERVEGGDLSADFLDMDYLDAAKEPFASGVIQDVRAGELTDDELLLELIRRLEKWRSDLALRGGARGTGGAPA
jgi:transcriptional regulator with XRE-family HTH domain